MEMIGQLLSTRLAWLMNWMKKVMKMETMMVGVATRKKNAQYYETKKRKLNEEG